VKDKQIVGISGKAGAGKDAVGEILRDNFGYTRVAFGDAVKREVSQALLRTRRRSLFTFILFWLFGAYAAGLTHAAEYYEKMPRRVRWALLLNVGDEEAPFVKPTSASIRTILQWWGTDYRRAQYEHYWIEQLYSSSAFRHSHKVYIPDVRFPNELAWIEKQNGLTVRVSRPGVTQMQHASEAALDPPAVFDAYIHNDGTLQDLHEQVMDVIYGTRFTRQ
jgi:hypothetical protein